ncbi:MULTISPECIES: thioesterase family protein [Halomonadaceae]|uniref:acyl-CoA thioesterase n=1 Tax=Halomonadaceae TaxID=28256 RepID=UPI001598866C|nr:MULTISPECIES: thioesterase family protein [Halomonas]QJQ96856.1 acyl-CoA thioesterase [Halomonas sp. PA5]
MYTHHLDPAFSDTDALGHINNTHLPVWFEQARTDIFRLFTPDLDPRQWRLILARYDVEFRAELYYGQHVEIRTYLTRLGTSSFTVTQEAWQNHTLAAFGNTVMVHYDHAGKRAMAIEGELRQALEAHLQSSAKTAT